MGCDLRCHRCRRIRCLVALWNENLKATCAIAFVPQPLFEDSSEKCSTVHLGAPFLLLKKPPSDPIKPPIPFSWLSLVSPAWIHPGNLDLILSVP